MHTLLKSVPGLSKKIIILGPAHPFRSGGITSFNERLAKAFIKEGHSCEIWSFTLQYPSFLFPGKSQYTTAPAPEGITIIPKVNSINPFNWLRVGNALKKARPDVVVVRFWLPFMGPALGTILRRVKKNRHTKVIAITDNVIPHEKRPGDKPFTKYFLKPCDAFIAMSDKVLNDLRQFESKKPARLVMHPLYDNFGQSLPKAEARAKLGLDANAKILLFFGFIRKYKGLDLLLEAMANEKIRGRHIQLLVAGEFYEDEKPYREKIAQLGISDSLLLKTGFIPDSDVRYYLCAADAVVQPYRNATQSGVTPLAYHFERPMIVTNVGGLPALVPDGKAGLVCEPEPASIANAIVRFYELGEDYFIPHLRTEKLKYSWDKLVNSILQLAEEI
jgi:glycosyltransferase involved in cell wall biosynthesis